ncbi:hypothetical protein CXB49_16025 [Chromobacterium sp. ATCC 53434]|uniref:phosphopantetheine-binding protein n=1 Tax=Chromobacterium TaxID=535 RepID=UPI000C75B7EB|nr:phosphopantetheine-binding protein [Chromobacterium sp. ATCC 53434]AUH52212.1 hypothetical protein CXB49_16025 [Chromobacterium sp. ATCC 53434]
MTKDDVFAAVKEVILDTLPDLDASLVTPERSLSELGANSVDRAEIVVSSMAALRVKASALELREAKNIGGLVDILHGKTEVRA